MRFSPLLATKNFCRSCDSRYRTAERPWFAWGFWRSWVILPLHSLPWNSRAVAAGLALAVLGFLLRHWQRRCWLIPRAREYRLKWLGGTRLTAERNLFFHPWKKFNWVTDTWKCQCCHCWANDFEKNFKQISWQDWQPPEMLSCWDAELKKSGLTDGWLVIAKFKDEMRYHSYIKCTHNVL
jgi:hypothetical protein